jgi:DNA polymerase-1
MADRSREPKLLKFYREGIADLHWFTAQQVWPELGEIEYDSENKEHFDKRQRAKMTNFAISYGGNGTTVATNMGIPEEEGIRIYEAYLAAFPKLSEYFDEQEKLAMERGYVLINEVTGGKRYIGGFQEFKEQEKQFTGAFWARYRREKEKNSKEFQGTLFPLVSSQAKTRQTIRKMALNTPCQGTGADMAKEAGLRIWEWIIANKKFGKVKLVNFVHDEWIIEAHMRVCPKIAPELQALMEETANKYLDVLTMEAEPKISKHWVK